MGEICIAIVQHESMPRWKLTFPYSVNYVKQNGQDLSAETHVVSHIVHL